MKIATLNVNGIRASLKKGLDDWVSKRKPDVLCLQEVRAKPEDIGKWAEGPSGMEAHWHPAIKPGYAGVALLSRTKPDKIDRKFGNPLFDDEGRWIRADYGNLSVVSVYLPSGSSSDERQQIKFKCMDLLAKKMKSLRKTKRKFILAGDINIAHTEKDIKNWKGNLKNSGFLPEERQWLTDLFGKQGWVDVFRKLDSSDGRYTWWSQRAGARARDVGWRIDYHIATKDVAQVAKSAAIDKDPVISDHAPVVIDYKIK